MNKKKLLIFHPALAPYRIDFFNELADNFDASFYFNLTNVADQKFDQVALKAKCNFQCNYLLNGFDFFGRSFRLGIIRIIKMKNPDIVICSEYGFVTWIVFLYKKLFFKRFKIYTISDDSINNSILRKGIRSFVRNMISKNIDGVIFASDEVCEWYKSNITIKTKTFVLPIIHSDVVFRESLKASLPMANENIQKHKLTGKKILLFVGRLVFF
jgi:hypothetical protein